MLSFLEPIEWVVSWIMVRFHSLFVALGMDTDGGITWALSIVGLVVVIRILLIPLFVKQIRSQRGLQMLQPQIKELQQKHKGDRERQSQEMMKLYKETGTNPLASCLPILAQAPIFFALFRVLNGVGGVNPVPRGVLTDELVESAANAELFGAPIAATFFSAGAERFQGQTLSIQVVAAVLIVLMSASMFITQKQLMTKNMPATALEGPFAQQQKILLYLFPIIFLVTGVNFPIGVLIYWFTTNIWSMCQQLFVIARMPAPGSVAEARLNARRAAKAARHGQAPSTPSGSTVTDETAGPAVTQVRGQRQQPKRQPKGKRQPPPVQRDRAPRPPRGTSSAPARNPGPGKGKRPGEETPEAR